jgi:hypothetical protein
MSIAKSRLICGMSIALLLGVLGSSLICPASAVANGPKLLAKQKKPPQIGSIKQKVEGAGCAFSYPGNYRETIFFSGAELPIVNIDGRDIQLKRVTSRTVGKRTIETYSSGNINVTINRLELQQLEGGSTYKVIMTVQRGSSKTVAKLMGSCGC